jgi:glycerol uptake operon antiterminator
MGSHLNRIPAIIPALRKPAEWDHVTVTGENRWVFLLGGTLNDIAEPVALLQRQGWKVFVHVDMVKGLSLDVEGLRFLKGYAGPEGVISTHSQTIVHAKKVGFATIQRIFLLDSQSVATGIAQVMAVEPDAVETLPGILAETTAHIVRQVPCPVIAGGLITRPEQVDMMLAAGVQGVSTSTRALWELDVKGRGSPGDPQGGRVWRGGGRGD